MEQIKSVLANSIENQQKNTLYNNFIDKVKRPNKRNTIANFFYRINLKIKSLKVFWNILTTNDPKIKSEMIEFQKYLEDKQTTERMLLELNEDEKKLYYCVDKNIYQGSDKLKRGIFQAARIVKKEEHRKKELKLLREKESLVKSIMVVLDDYIDKKVDLAIKIHEKEPNLSYRKKMEINSALKEALKIEQV